MIIGKMEKTIRQDWLFANPWPWLFLGLALCLANWLAVFSSGESLNGLGMSILFVGLLLTAAGVVIRLNSSAPSFMDRLAPPFRSGALLALAILFALIAVMTTVLLVLRFCEINPLELRLNALIILWFILVPMSVGGMKVCARRLNWNMSLSSAEESAGVLAVAALTTFCACRALYNPASPEDWDSLRLFLAALFVVALGAAPLMFVSQALRRLVISALIVLHFLGIATAVLSPIPSPWLIQQAWHRIYQPYLEFMYLNNAYHFYSPEPGPASFMWFRMYYEDPHGKLWAHWLKVPDLDDNGWHKNRLALEYQRMLAVTENVVPTDPTPSIYMTRPDGITVYAPWYAQRVEHSPNQILGNIGQADVDRGGLRVPFEPTIPFQAQYLQPNSSSRQLLGAYARHICLEPHPTHLDWKINSVRIYRVVHIIPQAAAFVLERMDPRDPSNYRPYYMGHYDTHGKLLDGRFDADGNISKAGDPFLYWLLPNLREPPTNQLKSPIKSWVAKHAGDPDWIYTYDETAKRHLLAKNPGHDGDDPEFVVPHSD